MKRSTPAKRSPKDGIGHAYDREPEPDHDSKGGIHRRLGQEIFAQAVGGVIDRRGRSLEVVRSSEPNQTVAQVLPLQQDEYEEDHDDTDRGERMKERADDAAHGVERARGRLMDLDGDRLDVVP